jgi:hypothetical protein
MAKIKIGNVVVLETVGKWAGASIVGDRVAYSPRLRAQLSELVQRHARGEWGKLSVRDKRRNAKAIAKGKPLLSVFELVNDGGDTKDVWILTDQDRAVTTVLFPEDYAEFFGSLN